MANRGKKERSLLFLAEMNVKRIKKGKRGESRGGRERTKTGSSSALGSPANLGGEEPSEEKEEPEL